MTHDKIAVVDFGGQYAHLIATKIRRLHVLAEIRQPEDPTELFAAHHGIVLSRSPSLSSHGEDSAYNKAIYDLDVPILGFCFGHQEIAKHYGGQVTHGGREWGAADLHVLREHPLFDGLSRLQEMVAAASSNRWWTCTRWRCASLPRGSACPPNSCGGILFRGLASGSGCCVRMAARTGSTSTRSKRRWRACRSTTALPAALISELTPSLLALDGVSGVALDLTSKPPGTIEWE